MMAKLIARLPSIDGDLKLSVSYVLLVAAISFSIFVNFSGRGSLFRTMLSVQELPWQWNEDSSATCVIRVPRRPPIDEEENEPKLVIPSDAPPEATVAAVYPIPASGRCPAVTASLDR